MIKRGFEKCIQERETLRFLLIIFLVGVIILESWSVSATDYYIDTTSGSDCGTYDPITESCGGGSDNMNNSWTDIEASLSDGDVVYFRKHDTIHNASDLDFPAGANITIDSYGTDYSKSTINGTGTRIFDIREGDGNITIKNLFFWNNHQIIRIYMSGSNYTGILILENCNLNGSFSNLGAIQIEGTTGNTATKLSLINITINTAGTNSDGIFFASAETITTLEINNLTTTASGTNSDGINSNANNGIIGTLNITNSNISECGGSGAEFQETSSLFNLTDSFFNNNGNNGFYLKEASDGTVNNCTFNGNGGVGSDHGFAIDNDADSATIIILNSTANSNGLSGSGDGWNFHGDSGSTTIVNISDSEGLNNQEDGISYHENCQGTITKNTFGNNGKSQLVNVDSSNVTIKYSVFYHDSEGTDPLVAFADGTTQTIYSSTLYSGNSPTYDLINVYSDVEGGSIEVQNCLLYGGEDNLDNDSGGVTITNNYNSYFNSTGLAIEGASMGANSLNGSNPLLIDITSSNFSLQWNSSAIDAGVNLNLTTDLDGNSIYGAPDIGAYEYHPPYNISADAINLSVSDKIRIYGDGKYRHINSTTSSINANLTLVPTPIFNSSNYSKWMDVNITSWTSSLMNWSESSDTLGNTTNITHSVCDLTTGDQYDTYYTKSGTRILISRYTVDLNGCIEFSYTQGYSTVTFDMQKYTAPVTTEEDTSQSGGGSSTHHPTQSKLQEGYIQSMGKNWKIKLNIENETHELKLNEIKNNSVTITISSEPITFDISINETKKINLNGDDYYDLSVLLKEIKGYRAELFIQEINETIPSEDKNTNKNEQIEEYNQPQNYCIIYAISGIVLIVGLIIFFVAKSRKKKTKKKRK